MRDRIFFSYRKADSFEVTGRLADRYRDRFGAQRVFFDVADIEVGHAWRSRIDAGLDRAAVMLVMIGPKWLDACNDAGQRRLDDPNDIVRREIEAALRNEASVVTVRVHGAQLPLAADLPESLRPILDLQGDKVRISDLASDTFDSDADRLALNVSRILRDRRGPEHDRWRMAQSKRRNGRLMEMARGLLTNPYVPPRITRRLAPDPFLRQDPAADIRDYSGERPITPYLPYVEIVSWAEDIVAERPSSIRVKRLPGHFQLESWGPGDGDALRDEALAVALHEKPKTFNGPAVRIADAVSDGRNTELTIQAARYFDQRRSNLALDFRSQGKDARPITMRDLLRQDYGARLPRLDDARLANTLGVAALILVREGEDLTPYLVSRSRDVAVFNAGGEWHCTASGVAELDDLDRTDAFFLDTMCKELDEEVGLLPHDLDFLAPVALCREMTRAGKPQMFFLGVTSVDRDRLRTKLTGARRRTKQKGWVVENTAMPLWRKPSDITDADALALFHDKGFTIEAAACMHYYLRCRDLA
jgi:hypothetical protein